MFILSVCSLCFPAFSSLSHNNLLTSEMFSLIDLKSLFYQKILYQGTKWF